MQRIYNIFLSNSKILLHVLYIILHLQNQIQKVFCARAKGNVNCPSLIKKTQQKCSMSCSKLFLLKNINLTKKQMFFSKTLACKEGLPRPFTSIFHPLEGNSSSFYAQSAAYCVCRYCWDAGA